MLRSSHTCSRRRQNRTLPNELDAAVDLDDVAYVLERGFQLSVEGLPAERAVTHGLHCASARETGKALHHRQEGTADPKLIRLATSCRAIA